MILELLRAAVFVFTVRNIADEVSGELCEDPWDEGLAVECCAGFTEARVYLSVSG